MADEHQPRGSVPGDAVSPPTPPQSIEMHTFLDELMQRRDDAARPLPPQWIRDDRRCHRCGCLLRGLKADGMCPECSFSIRDSIAAHGIGSGRDGLVPLARRIGAVLLPHLALVILAAVASVIEVAADDADPAGQVFLVLYPRMISPAPP